MRVRAARGLTGRAWAERQYAAQPTPLPLNQPRPDNAPRVPPDDHADAPVPAFRLAAVYFAYFAYVGAYSPYFSLYLQSIGTAAWEIGLVLGAMQLARVFAPNFWAWLADRSGERVKWLRISVTLGAIAFLAVFHVSAFVPVLLALVVHAFCAGGAVPLVEAITVGSLGPRMARYGAIRLWGSVGFLLAVIGVGAQLDYWPIASLLVTVSAILFVTIACVVVLPDSSGARRSTGEPIGPIIRQRRVVALMLAAFLMAVAHGPLYSFFSIYLAASGYSKSGIGWLWALGVIAEIAIFWWQPRWSRRIGMHTVLAACLAIAITRFALIGWGIEWWPVIVLAQLLHGATFGGFHVAAIALVSREFGPGTQVRGQAVFMSVSYGAGGMIGALISGLLWEAIGPGWTFTCASIAAAVGLAVAWPARMSRMSRVSRGTTVC